MPLKRNPAKDSPSQPLQQSLKDLERAYKNFFQNRPAFPHSKSGDRMMYSATRRALSSIRKTAGFFAETGLDALPEQPSGHGCCENVTVSQSCGKWYISIQTESEVSFNSGSPFSINGRAGCWRG